MRFLELLIAHCMEGFLIVGAGLGIMNIRPKLSKIACLALIYGFLIFAVRKFYIMYEIPFGTHSFVLITLYAICLKYIGRQNWAAAIIAPLISFFLINIGEGMILYNGTKLLGITMEDIIHKPGFRLVGTILTDVPLIIVFITGYILNISVIDINRFTEKEDI
ncbi:hypothetical protein R9X47_17785 [Wukongibacter baidiensis]|uniref:hypothetical protein n=1 Tax=Wukongibacter baidiensis TaxID=1723361 RepID=UPI003D7F6FD6